ncbi:uncharacterized protein LOC125646486 [Ostrea edulis]|uniref:uncharacterized protein LOC125646486 n=1 Tax=Ostrea edulis TaxID=37623 RepID=UPI00209406E7|nr:uncharacterized protein LOC125646486 [Ostrea edulis]
MQTNPRRVVHEKDAIHRINITPLEGDVYNAKLSHAILKTFDDAKRKEMNTSKVIILLCVLTCVFCLKESAANRTDFRAFLSKWIKMMDRLAARGLLSDASLQRYELFRTTFRSLRSDGTTV